MRKIQKIGVSLAMLLAFSGCSGTKTTKEIDTSWNYINDGYLTAYKDKKAGLINEDNKVIIDFQYDACFYEKNDETIIASKGGTVDGDGNVAGSKYGIIDLDNKVMVDFKYDQLSFGGADRKIATMGELQTPEVRKTVIDTKGKTVIEGDYNEIYYDYDLDVYIVIKDAVYKEQEGTDYKLIEGGTYGLFDGKGKEIIPCKYQYLSVRDGFVVAKIDGKYGVCDITGKEMVPFEYEGMNTVEAYNKKEKKSESLNNLLIVKKGDKEGIINTKNEAIIPIEYDTDKDEEEDGINRTGIRLSDEENGFEVSKDDKKGFINLEGKTLVECQYTECITTEQGFLAANYTEPEEDYYGDVVKDYVYFDKDGKQIANIRAYEASGFDSNGVAIVQPEYSEKSTLMNQKGEKILTDDFDSIRATSIDNRYIAKIGQYYNDDVSMGIIDSTGKYIIESAKNTVFVTLDSDFYGMYAGQVDVGDIEPVIIAIKSTNDGSLGSMIFYDKDGKQLNQVEANTRYGDSTIYSNARNDGIVFNVDKGHMEPDPEDEYNEIFVSKTDGQVYGLLDYKGNVLVEPKYISSNNGYLGQREDYYACVSKEGDLLIDTKTAKVKMKLDKGISLVRDYDTLLKD